MAQSTENGSDSLLHLKRYRSHLEENIVKLQKSLRHWQLWEAEYEGLKEEILGLGDGHTKVQLVLTYSISTRYPLVFIR